MALDPNVLKAQQKELDEKSSGTNLFIRLKKGVEQLDLRILEPSPAMEGRWYIEVPIWWIDKKRFVDPKFLDKKDTTVQDIFDEIERDYADQKDSASFKALRNKTGGQFDNTIIRQETEYWVPVLNFEWEFDTNREVDGIYDKDDKIDLDLLKKFIVDGEAKIFVGKVSGIKAINQVITSRGNYIMTEAEKGFNIEVSRSGTGRETNYGALKTDEFPMPDVYYGSGTKAIDPVKIVKGGMVTKEYIDAILGNYFYGEAIPEKPEYMFPELRESKEEEKPQQSARRRGTQAPEANTEPAQAEKPARGRGAKTEPTRGRRGNQAEAAPEGRNLLTDVEQSDE